MKKPVSPKPPENTLLAEHCPSIFADSIRGIEFATNPWKTRAPSGLIGPHQVGEEIRSRLVELLLGCGSHHVQELYNSALFQAPEFTDPSSLIEKLRNHSDPLSQYLWDRFSAKEKESLMTAPSRPVEGMVTLAFTLNPILVGPSIYKASRFAKVALSEKTIELQPKAKSPSELIRLNRMLLEDAYPQEIAKRPDFPRENRLQYRRELLRTTIFGCNLLALPFACSEQDAKLAPFEEGWPVVLSADEERAGEWTQAKGRIAALRAGTKHPARHETRFRGEFADFVNGWIDFALALFFRGDSYALTMTGVDHLWKIVLASFVFALGAEWQDHPELTKHFSRRLAGIKEVKDRWRDYGRAKKRAEIRGHFKAVIRTMTRRLKRTGQD